MDMLERAAKALWDHEDDGEGGVLWGDAEEIERFVNRENARVIIKAALDFTDEALIETVARVAIPSPFLSHASLYSYCIRKGDDEATARKYADDTHGPSIVAAKAVASNMIAAVHAVAENAQQTNVIQKADGQ